MALLASVSVVSGSSRRTLLPLATCLRRSFNVRRPLSPSNVPCDVVYVVENGTPSDSDLAIVLAHFVVFVTILRSQKFLFLCIAGWLLV